MPTYRRHNSVTYNLIRDVRDLGDTKSITRDQLGRNNFTRDQMLAANTLGTDRGPLLLEAARGNSTLRNLHSQMGNKSATGGFGGLGYAPGKGGVATKDYALPVEGNVIPCLISMATIPDDVDNYLVLSQAISKPHMGIYGRYAQKDGLGGYVRLSEIFQPPGGSSIVGVLSRGPENLPFLNMRGTAVKQYPRTEAITNLTYESHTSTTTTLSIAYVENNITIPVGLDPAVTYWFVRLYNKTTESEELFRVPYADCDKKYFGEGEIVNNYPNMPLSRQITYNEAYVDANSGDIELHPDTAEETAYQAANEAELDSIEADLITQTAIAESAVASQDVVFDALSTLTEEEQDTLTRNYSQRAYPALITLGLVPATYTEAHLVAIRDAQPGIWKAALLSHASAVNALWVAQRAALGYSFVWGDLVNSVPAAINNYMTAEPSYNLDVHWEVTDSAGKVHVSNRMYEAAPATYTVTTVVEGEDDVVTQEPFDITTATYTLAVGLGLISATPGLVEVSSVLVFPSLDAAYFLALELDPSYVDIDTLTAAYNTRRDNVEELDTIDATHAGIAAVLPVPDPIITQNSFAAAIPHIITENAAEDAISVLRERKFAIQQASPQANAIANAAFSKWGKWTYFRHDAHFNSVTETFMSEGFPDHDATKRFVAMIAQTPRTLSDTIREAMQSEGLTATMCDQMVFGCQATAKMTYAEMRYTIEFARNAWWHTLFDFDSKADSAANLDAHNSAGQSAWSIQHIEETMLNPGHLDMKSMRTRWGSCEVWIEAGQVDDGAYSLCSMNQTTTGASKETVRHPTEFWSAGETGAQELTGAYNIADGYVLKMKITGLATQTYSKISVDNLSTHNYTDYPNIPLMYGVLRGIPQTQVCQIQNEFMYIRTQTYWQKRRSNWVEFRDDQLLKIVGIVLTAVGIIFAIPSGGASLSLVVLGEALLYMAIMYAAMRVIAYFIEEWGLTNTWLGSILAVVTALVAMYFGMPLSDALLMATTVTADGMAYAYNKVNLEEAREAAGKMAKLDDVLDELNLDMDKLEEEQNWLDFYSASDLVKMRADAVEYVRTETPDKYYERMMGYQSNMLNLNGLDYTYDHDLDLDLN